MGGFGGLQKGAALLLLGAAPMAGAAEAAKVDTAPVAKVAPEHTSERGRRLLDEALVAAKELEAKDQEPSDDLIARFAAAAHAAPTSVAAQFDLAVVLERLGKVAQAEDAWRAAAAAKVGPKQLRTAAAERAAHLAVWRGDATAARSAAELAGKIDPEAPAALTFKAEVELALGNAEAARGLARTALMRSPKDVQALCALAKAQLALGQAGTARILALRAAALHPNDARPHLVLAAVAKSNGDANAELRAAQAATVAEPGSLDAEVLLGRLYLTRGDVGSAQAPFAKAVELDDESAAAHLGLGASLAGQGQTSQAIEELDAAAELAPKTAAPHLLLARLKLEGEGNPQAAMEEAKLYVKLSPQSGSEADSLLKRCERMLAAKGHNVTTSASATGGAQ